MKKAKQEFPAVIFVTCEYDSDNNNYLISHRDIEDIDDGTTVAVYVYDKSQKIVVNRVLEDI